METSVDRLVLWKPRLLSDDVVVVIRTFHARYAILAVEYVEPHKETDSNRIRRHFPGIVRAHSRLPLAIFLVEM